MFPNKKLSKGFENIAPFDAITYKDVQDYLSKEGINIAIDIKTKGLILVVDGNMSRNWQVLKIIKFKLDNTPEATTHKTYKKGLQEGLRLLKLVKNAN